MTTYQMKVNQLKDLILVVGKRNGIALGHLRYAISETNNLASLRNLLLIVGK